MTQTQFSFPLFGSLIFAMLFSLPEVFAQPDAFYFPSEAMEQTNAIPHTVSGRVVDHEGEPVSYAMVILYAEDQFWAGTHTDENGKFTLSFDWHSETLSGVMIEARFVDNVSDRLPVTAKTRQPILISLPEHRIGGGDVIPTVSEIFPLEHNRSGMLISPSTSGTYWVIRQL